VTASILVLFAGYTVASYGVVLLKGYDVPWRNWVNPLKPYTWPTSGSIPQASPTQVFPS
jgi:hypothetical protein